MPLVAQLRFMLWTVALLLVVAPSVRADKIPDWLPQYDLEVVLDVPARQVRVQQRVTFTNRHARPAGEVVFNAYPRFKIEGKELIKVAKTLELLRAPPSEGIDSVGRRLTVHQVRLDGQAVAFHWQPDLQTALVVPLPRPVKQGESITLELAFTLDLPETQGRWGHWKGTTYLANWYPILAYHDERGWHPTPFVPWHQPFFNEAGVYSVRVTLPADQKIASTGSIHDERQLEGGMKLVSIVGCCARDFAFVCSNRFEEHVVQAEKARVRVLAYPEHRHMAKRALAFAAESILTYNKWFGIYPYDEFDIVESHFPWNGNECSGMIMIDSRVFSMPHLAEMYVDHLISHETLHQWWYNVVGTNGYAETWMDEGIVSFYTARRLQQKYGKNAPMLNLPKELAWGPNIRHEDYRFNGMYGTLHRKEETKTVQPLPDFGNIVTLFSMTYDRGAKILGMIEQRLGDAAFFDFMRIVYAKYQFQVLRVADFQRELEAYTGQNWNAFFSEWLYGVGMTDWSIHSVRIEDRSWHRPLLPRRTEQGPCQVVVELKQRGEFTEPTWVGVKFDAKGPYEVRVPVRSDVPEMSFNDPPTVVQTLPDRTVRVIMTLPREPAQISVDPDQVLPDREPANNHWKRELRWNLTPLYTNLDDTDFTVPYDKCSITVGPWIGVNDPAFGQDGYIGLRAGTYRLQQFRGGVYVAYDAWDQDVRLGADAILEHWPFPHAQVGIQFDHSLTPDWADTRRDRGRIFGRYIIHYTPSLYLNPIEYVEVYGRIENEFWRDHVVTKPGIERYDDLAAWGVTFHRDYMTPYWDPEAGYRLDLNYENGLTILGGDESYHRLQGQFSIVKGLPEGLGYFSQTRVACQAYGGIGWPDNGEHFQLGGPPRVRGLKRATRQGSAVWVGSIEWRAPLWKDIDADCCDHVLRLRHLYLAAFYDVGEVYLNGRSVDGIAHSVGFGFRFDLAIFSFIERTTLRLDFAKCINDDEPMQVLFGLSHAF